MTQATLQERPYQNANLFTNHYLDERLVERDEWDCDDEAEQVLDDLLSLFEDEQNLVEGYGEDALIDSWINPVLEQLGYGTQPEVTLPSGDGHVDRLLFESEDQRREAAEEYMDLDDTSGIFEEGIGVMEAKQWDDAFDREFNERRPYRNASHQIKHYLEKTPENVQWGILTNGRKWRLYGTKDYETQIYYQVNLPELLERGDLEAFKYFYVLFRPAAFRESGDTTFLDEVWSESETAAEELGEDLQDNVFTALRVLGRGFVEHNDDLAIDPDDEAALDELKEQSLVLLYRLMFVLYAESRGLIHPETPSARDEYDSEFSLETLRHEIHEEIGEHAVGFDDEYSTRSTTMWQRLEDLFRLVDEGADDLGIPPYNGGLFDRDEHGFLTEHAVSNRDIAEVIYRLSTTRNDNGRYVLADYADLDTRHLGSVYEGLLEHQFRIAEEDMAAVAEDGSQVWRPAEDVTVADAVETVDAGGLYVVNDEGERKATGAYYTPDYVVTYIVEETVGPLVNEIQEDLVDQGFERGTQEYLGAFAKRVLDLKILDPAMGSGHFLTRATEYLAEQVMEEVREVEEEMEISFWDERNVRRRVAKECIYGVDVNGMAVELAKLSMWLETLAGDRPLAFLDHHLKTGNSLVGSDINEVLSDDDDEVDNGQLTLRESFRETRERALDHVMDLMEDLLDVGNETLDDVKSMEELYDEIREDALYRRLFAMANVHTAEEFGVDVPGDAIERMAAAIEDGEAWRDVAEEPWFRESQELADAQTFFHWELEFPAVFFNKNGDRRDDSGFDSVIGNPPYAPIQRLRDNHKNYFNSVYNSAMGNYDIYVLFVEKGTDILSRDGKFGFILPNKLFQVDYGEGLRQRLAEEEIVSNIIDFGPNQVFADAATTYTAILVLDRGSSNEEIHYSALADDSEPRSLAWDNLTENWETNYFSHDFVSEDPWDFHSKEIQSVIERTERSSFHLEEITESIGRGSSSGRDEVFELHKQSSAEELWRCTSEVEDGPFDIEPSALRKPIHSTDFDKYLFKGTNDKYLIWPFDSEYELYSENEFSSQFPKTWEYLKRHKERLEDRADYSIWYDYSAPRNLSIHDKGEILIPLLADSPSFAPYPRPQSEYVLMASGGFGISLSDSTDYSPLYVLSLINSKLLFLCLQAMSNVFRGGYITCTKQYFRQMPIHEVTFSMAESDLRQGIDEFKQIYAEDLNEGDLSKSRSKVSKQLEKGNDHLVHDILVYLAEEMIDLHTKKHKLNLSLFDHLGSFDPEISMTDIALAQPAKGASKSLVSETAEKYPNLRVGRAETDRVSKTEVLIRLTARYKPDEPEEFDTDQWGYTETKPIPALRVTELSEDEADLIEAFVPVAVDEASGFANFRETATKTKSLIDRLRELTLPAVDEVRDGLQSYRETVERAKELEEKIERTDALIDEIIYELYGLSEEEIAIVEEAVGD